MRQTLELALEALETAWYHVGTFCPTDEAIELYDEARAAIKEALAQPEQIQPDKVCIEDDGCPTEKAVLQRFWREHQKTKPEQEPVAWADHGVVNWIVDKQFKHASYLYEGSPPAPSKACIYCGQLVIKEKNT